MIWRILSQIDIDPGDLDVPKGNVTNNTVATALELVFAIAGAVALLIIVIAGVRYTMSQGDPQSTTKAKNAIIFAVIGLVIATTAFTIVRFVVRRVSS